MPFSPSLSGARCLAIALALSVLCALPAAAQCQRAPSRYALPPQRLDTALKELTRRSGCPVEVVPALVRGKQTQAVRGDLSPDAALIAMVRGTGLEVDADHGGLEVNRAQQRYFRARTMELSRRLSAERFAPAKHHALGALIKRVRDEVPVLVREQGFLSAAERVSYSAVLDQIAAMLKP